MEGLGTTVDIDGLPETRALLRQLQPELLKRLDSRIGGVAKELMGNASASFSATGASSSGAYVIKSRTSVSSVSRSVMTAPGSVPKGQKWSSEPGVLASIFEFANKVDKAKPANRKRVESLIATLNSRYGSPGRFLWDSWDSMKDSAHREVAAAVAEAEASLSARLKG